MIMLALLKETLKEFIADKAMRLSAALSYYSESSSSPHQACSPSLRTR